MPILLHYKGAKIYLHKEQLLIENRCKPIKHGSNGNYTTVSNNLDEIKKSIIKILLNEGSKALEELGIIILFL